MITIFAASTVTMREREKNRPIRLEQFVRAAGNIRVADRHKRMSIPSSDSMDLWLRLLFATLCSFAILETSCQTLLRIATKKINAQRYEDYTFEGELNRAKEECSYMSLVNDTVVRNKTLQLIKEKISHKKLKEFYEQKETEKQKAKEFYENVEKQSRRRVLEDGKENFIPERPFQPPLPGFPPPPPPPFVKRHMYKRWAEGRRRKVSSSFSEISFTDHNNCSSRCLFARMEMVNPFGFPDESLITKLIEDKITNKQTRLAKTKKVVGCFKKMEEVAFDDSCIFSARLFDCLELNEPYTWA